METNQLINNNQKNLDKSTETHEDTKKSNITLEIQKTNDNKEMLTLEINNEQSEQDEQNEQSEQNEQNFNNDDLIEELKNIKEKLDKERNESISQMNLLNKKDSEKNNELNGLYNNLKISIQKLKVHDKHLVLKTKLLTKFKIKKREEEELKKKILLKQAQINFYTKQSNLSKDDYEKLLKNAETEKNKENKLNEILSNMKTEISKLEEHIQKLKIIEGFHNNCEKDKKLLIKKYNILETDYKYELKKAEKLAKIILKEKEEDDNEIQEEYENLNEEEKAIKDASSILPRIKVLGFRGKKVQELEEKIIKMNKIGQIKNDVRGNVRKLYKKLDNIYRDDNHYIVKANSFIRKNRMIEPIYEDNYLFSENDAKIMKKAIPNKLFINYKTKFNDILQYKKNIEKIIHKEYNIRKNESELIINKCEKNFLDTKSVKLNEFKLVLKYQKIRSKIIYIKRKMTEITEQLKKIKSRIKAQEAENNHVKMFLNKLMQNEQVKKNS